MDFCIGRLGVEKCNMCFPVTSKVCFLLERHYLCLLTVSDSKAVSSMTLKLPMAGVWAPRLCRRITTNCTATVRKPDRAPETQAIYMEITSFRAVGGSPLMKSAFQKCSKATGSQASDNTTTAARCLTMNFLYL